MYDAESRIRHATGCVSVGHSMQEWSLRIPDACGDADRSAWAAGADSRRRAAPEMTSRGPDRAVGARLRARHRRLCGRAGCALRCDARAAGRARSRPSWGAAQSPLLDIMWIIGESGTWDNATGLGRRTAARRPLPSPQIRLVRAVPGAVVRRASAACDDAACLCDLVGSRRVAIRRRSGCVCCVRRLPAESGMPPLVADHGFTGRHPFMDLRFHCPLPAAQSRHMTY